MARFAIRGMSPGQRPTRLRRWRSEGLIRHARSALLFGLRSEMDPQHGIRFKQARDNDAARVDGLKNRRQRPTSTRLASALHRSGDDSRRPRPTQKTDNRAIGVGADLAVRSCAMSLM